MKTIVRIFILGLLWSSCKGQTAKMGYHPIVLKAKETSLYAKNVDWKKVNKEFIALAEGKQSAEELKPALHYLLNSLGDKHGTFRLAKDHSIVASYTGETKEKDTIVLNSDYINTVINDVSARFSYKLLNTDVGYLKIVGIGGGDVQEQADFIRSGLRALKEQGVRKWIVDLRFNGGGNMEPMFCGIAPLIGEGLVAGSINSEKNIRTYVIENGSFINYGRLACTMETAPSIAQTEKVAVLVSRYTVSSGELVAVAFKGRDHTRFIGEPTAGFTTGTGYDKLSDELIMLISQDIFMDRNKVVYENKVGVDEYIEFQHTVELTDDNQVKRAIEWLNE